MFVEIGISIDNIAELYVWNILSTKGKTTTTILKNYFVKKKPLPLSFFSNTSSHYVWYEFNKK